MTDNYLVTAIFCMENLIKPSVEIVIVQHAARFLKSLRVQNFGPIKDDTILFNDLTFLVGRNNAGKYHYLKVVELLLTSRTKKRTDIEMAK